LNKAIFLDRDGTINKEVNYLIREKDIEILNGVTKALACFKQSGFLNIIITNQSAVARGFISEDKLNEIHSVLSKKLIFKNIPLLDDILYSPYHKEGIIRKYKSDSFYRKPGAGLILKAMLKYNIDLKKSFLIGDSLADMQCADNINLKKILVLTGYGKKTLKQCRENNIKIDFIAKDLLEASKFIKKYLEY